MPFSPTGRALTTPTHGLRDPVERLSRLARPLAAGVVVVFRG
jgi:hypothetical protein